MNKHYTYFLILAVSLAGPLALSFDKKVAFYKKWKYLFPAMIVPCLFYIAWDIFFTSKGVWWFNGDYITGIKIINLPVEEVLFFVIVPYCCLFIYECVRCYFPGLKNKKQADVILQTLAVVLFIFGIFFITVTTPVGLLFLMLFLLPGCMFLRKIFQHLIPPHFWLLMPLCYYRF